MRRNLRINLYREEVMNVIERFLLDTVIGDVICALIERLTGCVLVPLSELDGQIVVTAKGTAAAKGAPASGD